MAQTSATRWCGTLANVRDAHRGHWFDREAERFFRTTYPDGDHVWGDRYFVTGERGPNEIRAYSVRDIVEVPPDVCECCGHDAGSDVRIETVGEFNSYPTAAAARRAIRELLAGRDLYSGHEL